MLCYEFQKEMCSNIYSLSQVNNKTLDPMKTRYQELFVKLKIDSHSCLCDTCERDGYMIAATVRPCTNSCTV